MQDAAPHTSNEPGVWAAVIDGVLYGSDAEVAVWINERLGTEGPTRVPFVAFGVIDDHQIVGGVMYSNLVENDITVSVALADGINIQRGVVIKLLDYPFEQLKLPRVTAYIAMDNQRALEQAMKIGFKLEGKKRGAAKSGGDVGVFGLLASECVIWQSRTKP